MTKRANLARPTRKRCKTSVAAGCMSWLLCWGQSRCRR
jgi:hypothetical protein